MAAIDMEDEGRAADAWEWDMDVAPLHRCPLCKEHCRCEDAIITLDGEVVEGTCEHGCA